MDLKSLNTFTTILECGSFAAAARVLNYTQSTITFQMQQLEQELSVQLFEKVGRKMRVTQAGKDLLPYINAVLQSAERLENYGKSYHELAGTLRVTCAESLFVYRLQPAIRKFREMAPHVKLLVQNKSSYVTRDGVMRGAADLGIHYDVGGFSSSAVVRRFPEMPFVLVSGNQPETENLDFITEGTHNPVTLISGEPNMYERLREYLHMRHITVDMILNLAGTSVVKCSVMSGLGIAFLPAYTIEEEIKDGRMRVLDTEIPNPSVPVVCVYHKNKWITPAMELFMKLTAEVL